MSTRRPLRVDGAHVLLTGASSGIGRALAIRLAAEGARLMLAARRTELLNELADEIEDAGSPRPHVVVTDLSVRGAAARLAITALRHFEGKVDIAINNAGASLIGAQTRVGDDDAARAVYEVNLWSPLAIGAGLLPSMLERDEGTIVNVTSTIQAVPLPLLGYYGSSKSALAQATRSLRLELAETAVRVVEVVPGATETDLRDVDGLPWKTTAPRTLPPVSPQSSAAAIVCGLGRGDHRIVYPTYSRLPLELSSIGQFIARIGGRRVDTLAELRA